ncbi:hypothetical protein [Nocardia rosealba]|uniref:hypothetical protein n=1 Tax=Nocardia rosealba TaxID=2878563 RepID=UPI001CD9DE4F|nr:hypothetical protein [Nocardia rosealba]MCA2208394.1 hypothetical protein [Nocardia rosealba]
MDAVYQQYASEMHERFGFLSTWLPSGLVEPGDVGVLVEGRFEKVTTLAALGIQYTLNQPGHKGHLDYSSARTVRVNETTDLDAAGVLFSSLTINFGGSGATFLQADDTYELTIADLHLLEGELKQRYAQRQWPPEYLVVHKVLRTGPAVVFVSDERDATVGLRLEATGGPVPIARAAARLTVTSRAGLAVNLIAPETSTPLFNAVQLRKRLGGNTYLKFRNDAGDAGLVPLRWPTALEETAQSVDP